MRKPLQKENAIIKNMESHKSNIEERLNRHPKLKNRMESLLGLVENSTKETADQAELYVIEELRKMGSELLHEWALEKESMLFEGVQNNRDGKDIRRHGKKNLEWYTTYGTISIDERLFLEDGKLLRPFVNSAEVKCKEYSMPLQRRVTDFGADIPFGKVSNKLEEHYGISIPYNAVRDITERQAQEIMENEILQTKIPEIAGVGTIIAETDGTMIPIVATECEGCEEPVDKRKNRKCHWIEARLSMAYQEGSVSPFFQGTIGLPDEVGDQLVHCAINSGLGQDTKIHSVGDGAPWIANQIDRVFGTQGSYLIDFYHLCEYLSPASKVCAPDDYDNFFSKHKKLMKENDLEKVLEELKPHIEADSIPDEKAPVRCCCRYIENRPGQFNYKGAIESGLPIGSGEIESAHRYVIQGRLKISGAWWKKDNARKMISLRILRENKLWDKYWDGYWENKKAA